jgi:hypothetical protein
MELDRSLAHAILRVALGLNLLVHGSVRIPAWGRFVDGSTRSWDRWSLDARRKSGRPGSTG